MESPAIYLKVLSLGLPCSDAVTRQNSGGIRPTTKHIQYEHVGLNLVRIVGFEPTTVGFQSRYSTRLSYILKSCLSILVLCVEMHNDRSLSFYSNFVVGEAH